MESDQVALFIDAMEAAFAMVGVTDMYTGAQRLLAFWDRRRPDIAATQSRATLEKYLRSDEPMNAEAFQKMVQLCMAFVPLVQQFLMQNMQTMADAQPRKNGPPLRITPQQKREIVSQISRLHGNGVSLGAAQQRIAQRFGYSLRSVQRVWRERRELAQQPFLSIEDVWAFVTREQTES